MYAKRNGMVLCPEISLDWKTMLSIGIQPARDEVLDLEVVDKLVVKNFGRSMKLVWTVHTGVVLKVKKEEIIILYCDALGNIRKFITTPDNILR